MKKKKKILILGGAGFIGFYLAKDLLENNILIIDNLSKNKKKIDKDLKNLITRKNIKFINKNILDINIKNIPNNFDYIFDLAATLGVRKIIKNSFDALSNNLNLSFKAIEIAKKQKRLKKIFFASTSEIYDGGGKAYKLKYPAKEFYPITIQDLKHRRTVYVVSKLTAEILYINSGLPFIIGRLHNVYGPRMGLNHVVPELISKFISKKKSIVVFSPNHTRTFCYYTDAIKVIKKLTFSSQVPKDIYNIGHPRDEIKIKNLSLKISNFLKIKKKIKFIDDKHNSPSRRLPDMRKTLKYIDKINFKNLDYGIKKTYLGLRFKWIL